MLREPAPAKVNLTLHVTGRRADGYHLLDSLVVFAGVQDSVSAAVADGLSLRVGGPFGGDLAGDGDNLVLRAARALAAEAGIAAGARLALDKVLPVASGIGGGSADAAAALRVLCRVWGVRLPPARLAALAAGLGADVPVCLEMVPRRMSGIGEVLGPAPRLPACGIVLVNPGRALSTQAVFRALDGRFSRPPVWPEGWESAAAMAADLARGGNDLQAAAVGLCPAVGEVLAALDAVPGALLSRMSGSGATCWALFGSAGLAMEAAGTLARPGWWVKGCGLYGAAGDT